MEPHENISRYSTRIITSSPDPNADEWKHASDESKGRWFQAWKVSTLNITYLMNINF